MNVVFLYDLTGIMAKPWLDAGYTCWCVDAQHPDGVTVEDAHHKVGMLLTPNSVNYLKQLIKGEVKMVFGFPPCTDLTVAGTRHWAAKRAVNPDFQVQAMALADLVRHTGEVFNVPWAFENPVGALSTMYRKPDFIFQPCDFGGYLPLGDVHPLYPNVYPPQDAYNKKTCIWAGNGFKEPTRKPVKPLRKDSPVWFAVGGQSLKVKNIRSATPRGFAQAVYEANK